MEVTLWSAEDERPRGVTRMHRDTVVHAPLPETAHVVLAY